MSGPRRSHSREFKLQVLGEADAGVPIAELCRRHELHSGMIAKRRRVLPAAPKNAFPGRGSRFSDKAKMAEMERLIGRQTIEIDFLGNALKRLKGVGR